MRALTIRQPWAWAIAAAGKAVENRTWVTDFRGPLAIHAGVGVGAKWEFEHAVEIVASRTGLEEEDVARLSAARGAVIAVATLTDVCSGSLRWGFSSPLHCDCGEWAVSQSRHFRLADTRPLAAPVAAKGALGLWSLPPEVESAVRAQLVQVA